MKNKQAQPLTSCNAATKIRLKRNVDFWVTTLEYKIPGDVGLCCRYVGADVGCEGVRREEVR